MNFTEMSKSTEGHQDLNMQMLNALNSAATMLLVADKDNFGDSLAKSMEIINTCVDVDRVYIWKNEIINGELYYVNHYEWLRAGHSHGLIVHPSMKYSYNAEFSWRDDRFHRDECINGPLSSLSPGEQKMLGPYGIKSLLVVPVRLHGQFWGFVSYDDCHSERTFTGKETDMLRSASLMMASVVNRIDQTALINGAHERTKLMLDSQPLCAVLFNRDASIVDCNEEVVKLFKVKSKKEFMKRFLTDLSVEFQPDGSHSTEKVFKAIDKAFENGRYRFEWLHKTADGEPVHCEVTLTRVIYDDEYIVAGFIRDMSEEKRMMEEIHERDLLLRTVNRAADILLAATEETFDVSLNEGISLLADIIDVEGVAIWRNEMRYDHLHYVLQYKWVNNSSFDQRFIHDDLAFPYSTPMNNLSNGKYINLPINKLPADNRELLEPYGVKSILLIPLFLYHQFWGFISFYNCHKERIFKLDEIDILHSASLMLLNALKRLEHSIKAREADERAKLMLNATPLGCSLWDKDEYCIDCNEEALKMYGLESKQDFKDKFFELSPEFQPDGQVSREKAFAYLREAFKEGKCTFDWIHQLPDGTPVPTEVTLIRVKYGDKYVVASYMRDLREYKQLIKNEEEARSVMNKTTAILENVDAMIFVADMDCNIIYMNQKLEQTFGVSRETCIGQKCYKTLRASNEMCPICQLPKILPDKDSLPTDLEEYRWDDYLNMWTESKVSIIRWVDDTLVQFHSLIDRTKEKAYEDELHKALEVSAAASASKTAFLANMSHEIRTPMNSIIGFAELAMDDTATQRTKDYLDKIIESAKWLLHIINDVLDISKIESGKTELENIPFDLYNIFMSCQSAILPAANEKGIALHVNAEPIFDKMLLGDPVRLYQALMNLLANAVKFTNSGSVSLLSTVKNIEDSKAAIHVEIKDTGIGITPEQMETIFDPFIQADVSITRNFGGTGLGLTITKNIIELMGGKLAVESTPGVGSKFSFELMLNTVNTPNNLSAQKINKPVEKPKFDGLILLCEDNRMNQEVICEHLARVGLKTLVAVNGKIGVEMVQTRIQKGQKPFDLIFMDMHMPVMDGLEATAKIIELGTKTPIVAMTANVMANDLELYEKSGLTDCIGKPFTTQELWCCLLKYLTPLNSSAVDEKEQAQENERLQKRSQADFVKYNRTRYDKITKAINDSDIQLAHRMVHSLKSNAGMIGKTRLQNAAAQVEALLKEGRIGELTVYMNILETELNLALEELISLQNDSAAVQSGKPLDTKQTLVLFEQLETMLKNINPECVDLLDSLRIVPGTETLVQQIDDYDFESALVTLFDLKKTGIGYG